MSEPTPPFARLRLDGARFADGRLPVESLRELERYQQLVIDVAVRLWHEQNPGRSNLPKHFRDRFHLVIADIEDGSATSVLEREETATPYEPLYKKASELVADAFAALVSGLEFPGDFPWERNRDFGDFGKSLRGDEAIELRPSTPAVVRYSAQVRAEVLPRLSPPDEVPVPSPPTEADGTVAGRLVALDAEHRTFRMKQLGNLEITGYYEEPARTADLRTVLDSSAAAPVIRVDGFVLWSDAGRPLRILDARNVELFEVDGMPWSGRFVELASLEEGWLHGTGGSRVQFPALDAARDVLAQLYSAQQTLPSVFPLEDGGVQLEWATPGAVTSVEISSDLVFSLFHLVVSDRRVEEADTRDFGEMLDFVRRVIG